MNDTLNTDWRYTASTIYKKPTDSKIFGSVELDVTELLNYLAAQRKAGLKITLTHFFSLATARAVREVVPEFNTYVQRGKIVSHPGIDVGITVLQKKGHLGSVKLKNADQITLKQSVELLNNEINKSRNGIEKGSNDMKGVLGKIPWPFRQWLYKFIKFLIIDLGFAIPFTSLNPSSFGSFVVSNIGSIGLDVGYPAMMPMGNMPFVLILGSVREKPWVHEGQIVPRKILTLSTAIDHRVADAVHGGILFKYLKKMIATPEVLEKPVEAAEFIKKL